MIGIGTDIVEIARVEAVFTRHPRRFSERILTPRELEHMRATTAPARFLARRFAAKEAIAKALGTGIGASLSWQDLQISNNAAGAPAVELSAAGTALLAAIGGRSILVSISDERAYAVAFAVVLQ
ncbi:MAG: holo-ACP synthase [Pseudomonadota bacterium]